MMKWNSLLINKRSIKNNCSCLFVCIHEVSALVSSLTFPVHVCVQGHLYVHVFMYAIGQSSECGFFFYNVAHKIKLDSEAITQSDFN